MPVVRKQERRLPKIEMLDFGAAPGGEVAVTRQDKQYWERSHAECRAFIGLIRRRLGTEPRGAAELVAYEVQGNTTVVCFCWTQDGLDYALEVERALPERWDEVAKYELLHQGWEV